MITAIPRLYGFIIAIIAVAAALMAIVIFGTRLTRTDYGCLYLDGDETAMLDINSGKSFSTTWTPELIVPGPETNEVYALSSDHTRVAYFKDADSSALVVQIFRQAVPYLHQSDFFTDNDKTVRDILWSPDDRFIAYHWSEGAARYLAIADANGNLLHKTKLNAAASDMIGFDSWSSDNKYLALVIDGQDSRQISFRSVPDLQLFDPGEFAHEVGTGCEEPGMGGSWWYCATWSPQGLTAAYTITKSDGKVQLVITTPGDSNQHVFDLPSSHNQTVRWSPDGKWVAIGSYDPGPDYSAKLAQIDLFGIDGTERANVGKAVEANLEVSDTTIYTEMRWSANSLLYSQLDGTDQSKYDVMRYQVDTGKTTRLGTEANAWPNETFFYPSPDNKAVAVNINDMTLFSLTDNTQFISPSSEPLGVYWSPDSSMMAYSVYDIATNDKYVDVLSSKGQKLAQFKQAGQVYSITWTQCDLP